MKGKSAVAGEDVTKVSSVCYPEHQVDDMVAEVVQPRERPFLRVGKAVADDVIEPPPERFEHSLRVFRRVGPISVKHEHVRLIDDLDSLDNGVALSLPRLFPDNCSCSLCNLRGPVDAVPIHDEDVVKPALLEFLDQSADRRGFIQRRDEDAHLVALDAH